MGTSEQFPVRADLTSSFQPSRNLRSVSPSTTRKLKRGRFSEEQMAGILREADRSPVTQVARKQGISEQTICTWRQRFADMSVNDVMRLRLLEQENTRLKKILAERDIEIEVMKEITA